MGLVASSTTHRLLVFSFLPNCREHLCATVSGGHGCPKKHAPRFSTAQLQMSPNFLSSNFTFPQQHASEFGEQQQPGRGVQQ